MIRFYLAKLGIHDGVLPSVFTKYDEALFFKWIMLKQFVYKDVLEYMVPFIMNAEQESFHKMIDDEFSSFCSSKNCNQKSRNTKERALFLITINDTTQIPYVCINRCCFSFSTKQIEFFIRNYGCCEHISANIITKIKFDKWLSDKPNGKYVLVSHNKY